MWGQAPGAVRAHIPECVYLAGLGPVRPSRFHETLCTLSAMSTCTPAGGVNIEGLDCRPRNMKPTDSHPPAPPHLTFASNTQASD